MAALGFTDQEAIAEYLNQTDINNVLALGYMGKDCFPRAMGQTYQHFAALSKQIYDPQIAHSLENIGWQVYEREAEYLPGAEELLSSLQGQARLFLLTQGDTEVQKRRLDRRGVLQYFDDLEAFANSDCIDAVYVASPNCCHYEQVMTLLKAGKHVLCEKPMASNLEQAQEMFAEAEKQNLILLEGMRSIYAPSFQKMIPYMETLGTIRRATLQYCQYSSRYDNYKRGIVENAFKPELSNGALMDIGVYVVSCMIRLFGAPKSIKASGVKLHNGVDGAGTILMEYPDMIGEAIYSKITDSAMPSQIQGEDASMLIQEIENVKDLRIVRKGVVQSIHFEQSDNILNYETQEFIKMIKTGMGWEKSKEITLETMKVLDEARKQLHIVFPADKKPKEKKK